MRGTRSAAALIYAVLSLLFLAPALLPGKTLSNSDALWFKPPFVTEQAGRARPAEQPRARRRARAAPALPPPHRARLPGRAAVEPLHRLGGRPFQANSQSAVFGPTACPPTCCRFWTALGLDRGAEAVGRGLRHLPARARAGHALRRRAAGGHRLRAQPQDGHLALVSAHERVDVPAVASAADGPARAPPEPARRWRAWPPSSALQFFSGHFESSFHVLLTTAAFFALRLWQHRRAQHGARIGAATLRFAGALAGGAALAAVSLIPLARARLAVGRLPQPARRVRRRLAALPGDRSASSCPTTGAGPRRRRCGSSCSSARSTSARCR